MNFKEVSNVTNSALTLIASQPVNKHTSFHGNKNEVSHEQCHCAIWKISLY